MSTGVIVGFVGTGVALVVFLIWTWLQVRRVDRVAREQLDDEGGE